MYNCLICENETHNTISYDLSYDFIYDRIKICAYECYPIKNGFQIIDRYKNKYLLFKINNNDFYRYKSVYSVLEKFRNKDINILNMYSTDDGKCFFNSECGDWYLVFNFGKGNCKKYQEFNFLDVKYDLKSFYNASKDIFGDSNVSSNLDCKNETDVVDGYIHDMLRIEKIISLSYKKDSFDEFYLSHKEFMLEQLIHAREFFLSGEYVSYYDDRRNLRFIHGNLSNRSFVYEDDKCFLGNFLDSSVGSIVKDLSILVLNMKYEVDAKDMKELLRELVADFDFKKEFHIKTLLNYLVIYNGIFKIIRERYLFNGRQHNENEFSYCELDEFVDNKVKFDNFAKNISFT